MLRRNSGFRPADAFELITREGVSVLLLYFLRHAALVGVRKFSIALSEPLFFENVYPNFGVEFSLKAFFFFEFHFSSLSGLQFCCPPGLSPL